MVFRISAVVHTRRAIKPKSLISGRGSRAGKTKYSLSVIPWGRNFLLQHVAPRYISVTGTWNEKPDTSDDGIIHEEDAGNEYYICCYPLPSGQVDKLSLLDVGFNRIVPMSRDFIPKTTPRSLKSGPGRGRALTKGVLPSPRPVVAREFTDTIYNEVHDMFDRMAVGNWDRLTGALDRRGFQSRTFGGSNRAFDMRETGEGNRSGTMPQRARRSYPARRRVAPQTMPSGRRATQESLNSGE